MKFNRDNIIFKTGISGIGLVASQQDQTIIHYLGIGKITISNYTLFRISDRLKLKLGTLTFSDVLKFLLWYFIIKARNSGSRFLKNLKKKSVYKL